MNLNYFGASFHLNVIGMTFYFWKSLLSPKISKILENSIRCLDFILAQNKAAGGSRKVQTEQV